MSTAISDTDGEKFAAIRTRDLGRISKFETKRKNKSDVIPREKKMNEALFHDVYEIF